MLLLLFSGMLWAQIPEGYYDAAEGKTGNELRSALHNIIKNHTVRGYSSLENYYGYTDLDENQKIIDIYSNQHYTLNQNGSAGKTEGNGWNKEHTWPQSWFGSGTAKSDIFHVYPTDAKVNNMRSNYPYAVVKNPTFTSSNGSKVGTSITPGYSDKAFEPADEYKGDIARTYFYMSTRYYTEDSGWKSSPMTKKCEIEPWAMTMLLEWSDKDPVSQKEIDRNNAIYNFVQFNRNPFIDHPEYAHMIWDKDWSDANLFAITCATGLEHGSVKAPAKAAKGSTVTITAVPDEGYIVDTWSAYKTGSPATTISVSAAGTFTMPDYAVTVGATFKKDDTLYGIDLAAVNHGTIAASATQALAGTTVTLTATPDDGYVLRSWYVYKTSNENTKVNVENNQFTMPAYNVTVAATFAKESTELGGDFAKVTEAPDDWSGTYLIVYEDGLLALDGSLKEIDAIKDTKAVTINDQVIASTDETKSMVFTIDKMEGGYSICSASGVYIGRATDANGIDKSEQPLLNTISMAGTDVDIVGASGAHLRYNKASNQERFRYYKASTYTAQQPIQLYRLQEKGAEDVNFTITFHDGNDTYTQTVKENEPTALMPNAFTKNGYEFEGWNTAADGSGKYYEDGATVTTLADLDLYAQWEQLYTVTCLSSGNGTVTAEPTEATEGTDIVLTIQADENYAIQSLTVTDADNNDIEVAENTFEMPASNVVVNVVFASTTTSISTVNADNGNGQWHAIDGRLLNTMPKAKGVYIVNGKKFIIK